MSTRAHARVASLLLISAALAGCASSSPPTVAAAPSATVAEGDDEGEAAAPDADRERILRPDEIFDILEKSAIAYAILENPSVEAQNLAETTDQPVPRSRPVDAYTALFDNGAGQPRSVRPHRPPEAIAELFGKAGEAFAAGELDVARQLYAQAGELEPDYFKIFTYLGNTLHLLGREADAEAALLRAIELNPVDYQALLFLGDTYYTMGQYHRAKAVLLRAYMLNRGSEAVKERLESTLARLELRLAPEPLRPAFEVVRIDEDKVEIRFAGEGSLRWMAMAACMACWAYEEACYGRTSEDTDPLRLSMYRECIINQAAAIAVRRDKEGETIPEDEHALLRAVEGGYLEAVIFWEVVGTVAPLVIYLLPQDAQDDILRYIEQFAIESTRLVEGPAPISGGDALVALQQCH